MCQLVMNFKNEVKNFHNLLIKSSERAISEGYTGAQHMLTKKDFKLAVFMQAGPLTIQRLLAYIMFVIWAIQE